MQAGQINMVHESEAQRRHSRVKIPCKLHVKGEIDILSLELLDLSASGFAVQNADSVLKKDHRYQGHLKFNFDNLEISINISFQVVAIFGADHRVGCEFHDLGRKEVSALRMIITKFLSGEVAAVGDVLTTLSRDNFAKARPNKGDDALVGFAKFKALGGTALALMVGLFSFAFVLSSLHQAFWVSKATTAVVTIPSDISVAPREGYTTLLVKQGQQVSKGQALLTIDSPLLEMMQPVLRSSDISQDEMMGMMSANVSSVIESRCDCVVVHTMTRDGYYIQKGESAIRLAPVNEVPEVTALFEFSELESLAVGTPAKLVINGGDTSTTGSITKVTVPDQAQSDTIGLVEVTIKPEQALVFADVDKPVTVEVGSLF